VRPTSAPTSASSRRSPAPSGSSRSSRRRAPWIAATNGRRIRARQIPGGLTPTEAEIVAYATGLLGAHRVEAGLFEGLRKRLGPGGMVDLTATVGYYAMLACTLNAFDVQPEPGADLLPV
jgi:hypothetical protein